MASRHRGQTPKMTSGTDPRRETKKEEKTMARMNRLKKDGDAHYHVMSRTNGRAFLLKDPALKREIVDLLKRSAAFSGIELKAYCIMDDHFHFVCKVTKPDEPVDEKEILKRIAILKGEKFAKRISGHWAQIRESGLECQVEEELAKWRGRMHDISEMAKTFKELVNVAYKKRRPHCGGLWSGRFKSTIVEDGKYLATCVRYVELNPVRARMVNRAHDYAFSSRNSAALYAAFDTGEEGGKAEEQLMRRIAQIGSGVVFGGYAFVAGWAGAEGWRAKPKKVLLDAYSSHGHSLAKAA